MWKPLQPAHSLAVLQALKKGRSQALQVRQARVYQHVDDHQSLLSAVASPLQADSLHQLAEAHLCPLGQIAGCRRVPACRRREREGDLVQACRPHPCWCSLLLLPILCVEGGRSCLQVHSSGAAVCRLPVCTWSRAGGMAIGALPICWLLLAAICWLCGALDPELEAVGQGGSPLVAFVCCRAAGLVLLTVAGSTTGQEGSCAAALVRATDWQVRWVQYAACQGVHYDASGAIVAKPVAASSKPTALGAADLLLGIPAGA